MNPLTRILMIIGVVAVVATVAYHPVILTDLVQFFKDVLGATKA